MADPLMLEIGATVDVARLQQGLSDAAGKNAKFIAEMKAEYDRFFNHIDSAFRPVVTGLVQGTQTIGKAFSRMETTLASEWAVAMEHLVAQFIAGELKMLIFHEATRKTETAADKAADQQKRGLDYASTLKAVTNQAAQAAAKAYSWGAGIGGPPLGAVMAAIAFAGVEAFGALASAAGGMMVNADQLALVHRNEMVLPAYISQPLVSALRSSSYAPRLLASPSMNFGTTATPGVQAGVSVPVQLTIAALDGESVQRVVASAGKQVGDIAMQRMKRYLRTKGVMG